VVIDLSKGGIGLFARDTRKKSPTLWQKIKKRARNYDRKEKRKKDYCNYLCKLNGRLLEELLDTGLLVNHPGLESTTHDRRKK
jgi:deoxyadenosine/deoxycytidine kinase